MSYFPAALPLILPVVLQHGHLSVHALVTLPATQSRRLIINATHRSVYCLLPDGFWPPVEMLERVLNKWSEVMRQCHVGSAGVNPSDVRAAWVCACRAVGRCGERRQVGKFPRRSLWVGFLFYFIFLSYFSSFSPSGRKWLARLSNYFSEMKGNICTLCPRGPNWQMSWQRFAYFLISYCLLRLGMTNTTGLLLYFILWLLTFAWTFAFLWPLFRFDSFIQSDWSFPLNGRSSEFNLFLVHLPVTDANNVVSVGKTHCQLLASQAFTSA